MRLTVLTLVCSLALLAANRADAAAPTRAEKVAAIATVVKTWREHPKDSPAGQQLGMAVAILVLEASGALDPMKPTPEEQKKVVEVVTALKAQGADPSEAVDAVLSQFRSFACMSKQGEAKANLRGLLTAEKAYFAEFGTYEKSLQKVGFEVFDAKRYRLEVVKADKTGFQARAVGTGDMVGDEWVIDDKTPSPSAVKNLCPK